VLAPHAEGAAHVERLGRINVHRFRYFWPVRMQTLCYQGGALINLRRNAFAWLQVPVLIVAEMVALFRLARRRKYDVLHAHWIVPQGFVAVIIGLMIGIPVVVTAHGSDVFALRGRMLAWFKRFALNNATAVTANSSETSRRVRKMYNRSRTLHRIPMGAGEPNPPSRQTIDAIRARYAPPGSLLLIFVGRLVAEKGLGELLAAFEILHSEDANLSLLVLGDGQDRDIFERASEKRGIAESVHFLGWVAPEAVSDYLAAADIFILPSKFEGQGLSIVEALLSETPVIATGTGGIPDIVEDRVTGILIDEATPEALARAVRLLADDPALRRKLGQAGCAHARAHFTRAKSAEAFSALYSSVQACD